MLYIYITFYLNGSGEVNVMKIVNGTRASSDGIINSLRSRPSAARFARINNNYSPKWRWLVLDIYRTAKQ